MGGYLRFFGRFLRNPRQVGAVAPSSRSLAQAITSAVALGDADAVVELGPGNGAFTSQILGRLRPGALFFALDTNPAMCRSLQKRFPHVHVHCDSASRLDRYLKKYDLNGVDCIVSGLPWAAFGARLQDDLMAATYAALRPGGEFATFAYVQGRLLPSGRRFHRRLKATFSHVSRTPVVWLNFPPAFVYRCVKSPSGEPRRRDRAD
jgi:phospholipid N-methyltransferase